MPEPGRRGRLARQLLRSDLVLLAAALIASGLGGFLSGMAVPNPRVFGKATVIHSDDDRLVPPAKSEELAAAIGARTVVVPGAGHFLASDGVTALPEVVDALRAAESEKRP